MSPHSELWGCDRVDEQLEAYIDGELEAEQQGTVAFHLESCSQCRASEALALAVREELRALPQLDAPAAVIEQVIETARRDVASRRISSRSLPWWKALRPSPVWALAAATLLVAVLVPLGRRGEVSEQTVSEQIGSEQPGSVQMASVDAAQIDRAVWEARVALSYVSAASRRAGVELRDDVIMKRIVVPTVQGLRPPSGRRQLEEAVSRDET